MNTWIVKPAPGCVPAISSGIAIFSLFAAQATEYDGRAGANTETSPGGCHDRQAGL